MDGILVQPADEEHGESPEREPGPARKIEAALKPLDLLVQEQRGDAEGEAEQRHAAERDRHADHALPPDRLEHEQAEDAVHEIKQPDHVLGRPEMIMAREERRLGGEFGDEERWQPDETPADHPPHALIILGRLRARRASRMPSAQRSTAKPNKIVARVIASLG